MKTVYYAVLKGSVPVELTTNIDDASNTLLDEGGDTIKSFDDLNQMISFLKGLEKPQEDDSFSALQSLINEYSENIKTFAGDYTEKVKGLANDVAFVTPDFTLESVKSSVADLLQKGCRVLDNILDKVKNDKKS